ncbi:hypothetical protein SLEP1_g34637 [Rubroshorea leprosula]|uniref:Uncharacterized protein n=1 Tax=Rubroshorea leprosula TaxID=152421 RepID=A0AAV5KKL1_9ROSI|nr:hypothetical protein SLEP1_g34637 [Rubroshorea leprosula]
MATAIVPYPSSPPSASSASDSETSPTKPTVPSPPQQVDAAATGNGGLNAAEQKPVSDDHFAILDHPETIEKNKKYEADYTRLLMAKYFSKKNIYGGDIYDETTTINNETILSSRWPFTQSYADPTHGFEGQASGGSTSGEETPVDISDEKPLPKQNN